MQPPGIQLGRPEMRLTMGPEMLAFFWTVFWTWISETKALLKREVVAVQEDAGVGGVVAEVPLFGAREHLGVPPAGGLASHCLASPSLSPCTSSRPAYRSPASVTPLEEG